VIAAHPQDPLPYAFRAAADLFYEMDRLGYWESEFLSDDKRIVAKKKLNPTRAFGRSSTRRSTTPPAARKPR